MTTKKTAIARISERLGPPDAGETADHEREQRRRASSSGPLEEREVEVPPDWFPQAQRASQCASAGRASAATPTNRLARRAPAASRALPAPGVGADHGGEQRDEEVPSCLSDAQKSDARRGARHARGEADRASQSIAAEAASTSESAKGISAVPALPAL